MAAGATYEPIATTTLASAATNITFSSISSAYTDLKLVLVSRSTRVATLDGINLQFNSDTVTNYSDAIMYGDGSSALASRDSTVAQITAGVTTGASSTASIFGLTIIDIFSYAGSTNKTCLCNSSSDQNGSGRTQQAVGLWRSTAAINAIKVYPNVGPTWAAGTTATLYGILKA